MMIVHGSHRRRELRRIANAFRVAGALAPERAKPLAQLGLADSRLVRSFVDKRIIREVRAGEFYLDDDAWRRPGRAAGDQLRLFEFVRAGFTTTRWAMALPPSSR